MSDVKYELVSPAMHPAFRLRVPSRELYQLPDDWFETSSGPVFGRVPVRPGDNDLLHMGEGPPLGPRITLKGRIVDSDGRGIPNALIEIWQANAGGRYIDQYCNRPYLPLDPNFTGAGRSLTDSSGNYVFHTIRPSGYAGPAGTTLWRAAHVHFSIFGPNLGNRLITVCHFEHDPLLAQDVVFDQYKDQKGKDRMIAKWERAEQEEEGPYLRQVYNWDIVLRGAAATPMQR
jgi:protocatechuate 3,4-dioxygenase beta subunit